MDLPFDNVFGDTPHLRILQEFLSSESDFVYTIENMSKSADVGENTCKEILEGFVKIGIVTRREVRGILYETTFHLAYQNLCKNRALS